MLLYCNNYIAYIIVLSLPNLQAEQDSESENDVAETTPSEDLIGHVEKLIELRKRLDTEVKGNVSEAQKRQKKQ